MKNQYWRDRTLFLVGAAGLRLVYLLVCYLQGRWYVTWGFLWFGPLQHFNNCHIDAIHKV